MIRRTRTTDLDAGSLPIAEQRYPNAAHQATIGGTVRYPIEVVLHTLTGTRP